MVGFFGYIWRNSRREQIKLIGVVVLSLPFYYLSLDVPRHIISDALQGQAFVGGRDTARLFHLALNLPESFGGPRILFEGIWLDRQSYLFALSGLFLLLVLISGGFKYVINMRKGALGERLLQRLRLDLFSAILRFRPEMLQRIKPPEAATIIKDEVEPIGGFVGDAFVQPVFLAGQALTALAFILVQNVALGLIAASMILVQGAIIPRLRREQIRLGRQRQIESRAFAGKIGEVVETMAEVTNHGTSAVERSQVAQRLERLFGIRYRLYGRKFAVKTLNNLLAQITPFLFYVIGGYFALAGRLDLGQLIAVIAAYRDLPSPVKELIDWDQQRLDVEAKFQQVVEHFALDGDASVETGAGGGDEAACLSATGQIVARGLSVTNPSGDVVLDRLSLSLPLQRHIALSGGASEGAGVLAQLLGGGLSARDGALSIADMPLSLLSAEARGRAIAYLGPEPLILDGSLRDNILYGLRRVAPDTVNPAGWSIDPGRAGAADEAELELKLIEVLRIVGLADAVFRFGLACKLDRGSGSELVAGISAIRARVRAGLAERGIGAAIEPYDPARYTRNATIGENIVFGVPLDSGLVGASLANHELTRRILTDLGLTETLLGIGRRIAATMLEIFADLPPGHVLFEQYSFIAAEDFQEYGDLLGRVEAGTANEADDTRLIGLALLYVEPRHRLGLLDRAVEARILAVRAAFHERAPADPAHAIAFYDPRGYCAAAPVRDNVLFGAVAQDAVVADEAIRDTLAEFGLDAEIYRRGLEQSAGYAGRLLFPAMKTQIALARCLIKQPELLILNNAFGAFGQNEARQILSRIRAAMAGRTVIVAGRDLASDHGYDLHIAFEGARLAAVQGDVGAAPAEDRAGSGQPGSGAAARVDADEIRVLRSVPIFGDLDTARLKLLAFTGERMVFAGGEVLFRQGDEADAAYVLLSGTAEVMIDAGDGGPARVWSLARNAIVGEMGLVTDHPRSATVVATSDVDALKLRKDVFLALLAEFPNMALSVTRLMVERLRDNVAATGRQGPPGGDQLTVKSSVLSKRASRSDA
ncbi:cyclic nucleotide-binding domain-containing protein [Bosea rubneri]|uniref:Cyclic nucleotide-binding domain-containing protein n=1 Tax=Bosea rubneri TaxID=3075434 RepID=A0ABU3S9S4_9HYPH|nr:cyclic nucleotide-binding domain-containing protein [Bosea sp. ZW T0_25]MDU0341157.1 cyclic nucleotide-binding domain-containing protein [Bosea sp. ZW T0_25]